MLIIFFSFSDHQNWFGLDENLGPVAVSLKREKVERCSAASIDSNSNSNALYQYRLVIRTSEVSHGSWLIRFLFLSDQTMKTIFKFQLVEIFFKIELLIISMCHLTLSSKNSFKK